MRCNLHILASSLMAISIFGWNGIATANHDGVGQGVVAKVGDSPAPAAPEIWHRASWGTEASTRGTISDLFLSTAPVDAATELAGADTADSSPYYEFQEVLPDAPATETPLPGSPVPQTAVQVPLDSCSCCECCGPTHAQITYARQCPGYQGLSKLEQLHTRISLSDTPLCGGHGGCPPPNVMSGDYTAVVFTRFVDKELVRSWLPNGLILDPDCPFQDCHPIIIMCGEQRRFARTTDRTVYPLWGRYYDEVFMSIPWVKMAKSPEKPPLHHFFHVYLNSWPATYLGIERGWPKYLVPVRSQGNCYSIFDCHKNLIFKSVTDYAHAEPVCGWGNESLQWIRTMLEMPMVLRKPHECGFKVMDFNFHFDCAQIHSVCSDICINCGFLPGLPPAQETVPGINQVTYGAFHLNTRFTARKIKY